MVLDSAEEERLNVFDIDAEAGIFGLSEYAAEIFQHLRESEVRRIKYIDQIEILNEIFFFPAIAPTQDELHAKTARHNVEHAFNPGRLVGRSG